MNLFIPEIDPSPCQVVRRQLHPHFIPRQDADIVHPHFPRDGSQYLMTIFQLHPEHSIGQGLYYCTILFYKGLFRHIFWERKGKCISAKKEKTPRFFRGYVEKDRLPGTEAIKY